MRGITISEHFYSIQGEGTFAGYPAVFLRLSACNLMCGGQGTEKDQKLHDGATWRCDTIETWMKGTSCSIDDAMEILSIYAPYLRRGAHLVITGGEPLLQQEALQEMLARFKKNYGYLPYVEIETNGTVVCKKQLTNFVDLYTVSPKLSNSGMPKQRRIREDAMLHFVKLMRRGNAELKFVVSSKEDVEEVIEDFIDRFDLPNKVIWLMPAASDQTQLTKVLPIVAQYAKRHGFKLSTRLQVAIWNKTVGV